jgi:hypothetical protein
MSRKKNYEVLIKAYATVVVVGAKNQDEALNWASEEISTGDFQIESAEVEREIKGNLALERAKAHADCISEG